MESMEPGLRLTARTVAKSIEETDKVWFTDMALTGWESHPDVYQVLKKWTTCETRKTIMGATRDNGWEAWRRLTVQYEPASAIKQCQQLCELAALGHKKCKNPQETFIFLLAIKRRIQAVVETSGESPTTYGCLTILLSGMDDSTKTNCAATSCPDLKLAVQAVVNLVCGTSMPNKKDAMDINQIGEGESEES